MRLFLKSKSNVQHNRVNVTIHTAKPGMVIGKGGTEVETLRKALNQS